jgi:hypothetical protein
VAGKRNISIKREREREDEMKLKLCYVVFLFLQVMMTLTTSTDKKRRRRCSKSTPSFASPGSRIVSGKDSWIHASSLFLHFPKFSSTGFLVIIASQINS